jgi:AmmeMemoRadiSam system protein B
MDDQAALPALRAVDVVPFETEDGETHFQLVDRLRIAPNAVSVSAAGYFVLAQLDGQRSCSDVQAAFLRDTGMRLPAEQVRKLVSALDESLLLETGRFEEAYAARRSAYAAADARDNRDRYPSAEGLRSEIERMLSGGAAEEGVAVRGIVAPHLDYARGAPCYADAYAALAAGPWADRFVILGANHGGRGDSLVATRKDFLTPLGRVGTDVAFVDALERELGGGLCEHELDHLWEHSIELHVHVLQVLARGRAFSIVPVLCPNVRGAGEVEDEVDGAVQAKLAAFGEALSRLVASSGERTVLIAGADLSHVGQRFGEAEATTEAFLERVGEADRGLLRLLEQGEADTFFERVRETGNATRICSVGCIYALLRGLPGGRFRMLRYHQAVDFENEMHVTCAAGAVA